jgi:hypothetical protein
LPAFKSDWIGSQGNAHLGMCFRHLTEFISVASPETPAIERENNELKQKFALMRPDTLETLRTPQYNACASI